MAEISKTPKKGLSLPEHYDPSVDKLRENMTLIDSLLQQANPNDLSSISDGESNINTLTTTGRYLVKSNATGYPISGYAGIVDVFRAGTYILQEWRSINSSFYEYRRYSTNSGSSWNSWIKCWNAGNDGSGSTLDADLLDTLHSSSFYRKDYTSTDFNSAVSEGKYRISSGTNAPHTGCTDWICVVYHLSGGTSELYQIAMEECGKLNSSITGGTTVSYLNNIPMIFARKRIGNTWYSWQMFWHSGNGGEESGLNADKLDDKHASDFVSCIKSTSSTDIDTVTTEGMYEYTDVTSTKGLPSFTGSGAAYGLIVKSVEGSSSSNCCFQILLKDGCSYVYMRYYHGGTWSSWEKLNPTASELLTKIKTVDGSGSGLDADTIDGMQLLGLVKTGYTFGSFLNGEDPNGYIVGANSQMYTFYDTANLIGEGEKKYYGIIQIYYNSTSYMRIAVSFSSGRVYRQTSSQTAWNEITPLIPVVSSDPTSPSEGQLWILTD